MKSKIFLTFIIFSLVAIPVVWYNLSNKSGLAGVQAIEESPSGPERRFEPGEIVFCSPEIPIGEAIEEAHSFACTLLRALSNIQWATNQYRKTAVEIADLASQCDSRFCSPSCTLEIGNPDDPADDICIPNACAGDPCPHRAEIQSKYEKLASFSRTLVKEKETIDWLLNVKRLEIKKKLDESRRLFEKNAPTVELYELLRGPTTCEVAINNFWVELQDVQDKKVCKSLLNWLVCR